MSCPTAKSHHHIKPWESTLMCVPCGDHFRALRVRGFPGMIMAMMADHAVFDQVLSMVSFDLKIELDRLIVFLNNTLHNYERPVKRGFFISDTSIRYPYSPDETVSIPTLLYIVILPLLIMIIINWMFLRPTTFQRPGLMGVVGGSLLTALLTACIKLATGRLAPNFYDGCGLDMTCQEQEQTNCTFEYITNFTCLYPERLREMSRSFPCMYTSVSSFTWIYLVIYWLYTFSGPSFTRTLAVVTSLAPPTIIAFTRYHDYRSHPGDVIAGCMLGGFIAAVSAMGRNTTTTRCKSDKKPPRSEEEESYISEGTSEATLDHFKMKPFVRVCSSALLANIEGFIDQLQSRSHDDIDGVVYEQLPYNDLDAFTLDEWDKNDVIILCHSINNRRLSLTDVTDALYDKFIPKASKLCGKDSLIVIAHDFKWTHSHDQTKSRMDMESTLRAKQPTVFKHAGNVLLAGKLGEEKTYDGLLDQDWAVITDVISNRSNRRR